MQDQILLKIKITHLSNSNNYIAKHLFCIKDIKTIIQDKEGFPIKLQYLFFNSKILDDDKTLFYYNIKNYSNLNLSLKSFGKIIIFIKPTNGQTITLDISKDETIKNLKQLIEKKEKIPEQYQILKYRNILLENRKTLDDYNINEFSKINLSLGGEFEFRKMYIKLCPNRRICLNIINNFFTIKDIKKKISKLTKIPSSEQVLYCQDKIFGDDITLNLDINENNIFKLVTKTITIFIKSPYGYEKEYIVNLIDTIKDLKEKIGKNENKNILEIGLIFDDDELENNMMLYNTSIRRGSCISLFFKVPRINIFVNVENKLIKLFVNLFEKIQNIKEMIFQNNIKGPNLIYGGRIMNNDRTLADYNIQNNSTIFLY